MGRFHRHDDGTVHTHEHDHPDHEHDHGDHTGYLTGKQRIDVLEAIFAENDVLADANRAAFESNGIRTLNLMSSPGSGKTTILQATLDELAGEFAIGVIEGDIATDLDAAKLSGRGAPGTRHHRERGGPPRSRRITGQRSRCAPRGSG